MSASSSIPNSAANPANPSHGAAPARTEEEIRCPIRANVHDVDEDAANSNAADMP